MKEIGGQQQLPITSHNSNILTVEVAENFIKLLLAKPCFSKRG